MIEESCSHRLSSDLHMHVMEYTHIHTHTHTHTHAQIHTHSHIHAHTLTHTYIYTQTYSHTYIHTHMHRHTHIPFPASSYLSNKNQVLHLMTFLPGKALTENKKIILSYQRRTEGEKERKDI